MILRHLFKWKNSNVFIKMRFMFLQYYTCCFFCDFVKKSYFFEIIFSSQTSKRYEFSKYLSFTSNLELTDWSHKLEKTIVFLNLCIVSINKKTHFCVKKEKNEKICYCKNKKHVFWRKNAISFFCITHKMKSVYFSKIMKSLMLLWKQQKNMKKMKKKTLF